MPGANPSVPSHSSNGNIGSEKLVDNQEFEELGLQPVRRPVNIEKDVTSLGQKKRVSSILRSPDFKEELESVVTDILRSDGGGGHVIAQALANVFSPGKRTGPSGVGCVSPINDLTGADTLLYSKGEKLLRCKLAALYRIVDLYGWTSAIFNHITVRVSQEHEHFLINPFGLLYHEVSASKLIKVNMQGEVIDGGSTTLGFNQAGYTLHSAIHSARPDLHCVIHVHTSDVIAVSCMECGLLPISQEALIVGNVSIHPYHGILVDNKEKKLIQKHLGPNNKVMFLRNHGMVACGETVEEAFHYLYFTMLACNIQVKAMSCMKPEKLIQLDRSMMKQRTEDVARRDISVGAGDQIQWGVGEMLFEAHIRMLDDMGYRSGYSYRNPIIVHHKPRVKSDVELPPTAVGHTPVLPEDLENARGQLRHQERPRWVNSPNQYTRVVEAGEEEDRSASSSQNGDTSPRARTKWKRADDSSKSSTAVRINSPNQFVPTNTDPREVLELRKSIRGKGRYEFNRPGPQSQLLYNVSPDHSSQGIHSSSKAIIKPGNDVVLVTPAGPPNPFNVMREEGLQQYEQEVTSGHEQEVTSGHEQEATSGREQETTAGSGLEEDSKLVDQDPSVNEDELQLAEAVKQAAPPVDIPSEVCSPKLESNEGTKSKDEPAKEKPRKDSGENPVKEAAASPKSKTEKKSSSGGETPKSPRSAPERSESGKKKKKRPLSFLKKKK